MADGIFRIVDENLDTLLPQPITSLSDPVPLQPADKLHSWLLRWQYEVFIRFSQRVDPYESNVLQSMLDSIKETGGFMNENLKHRVYHSPVGWPGKESLGYENAKELGEVMATNTLVCQRSFKHLHIITSIRNGYEPRTSLCYAMVFLRTLSNHGAIM